MRTPFTASHAIGAALAALTLIGCSSTDAESSDKLLAPPAAGKGIQLEMVTTIEPGSEVEHCKFVKAPAEGLWINRTETRFTAGSHHVLLYRTNYSEIPTAKLDGTAVDTSGVFDCSDGATNGWDALDVIGGSQNADGGTFSEFPANVAMRVEPNTVLMINAHYINTSPRELKPEVFINLETIPEAQVEHEGGILFFYNAFIRADGMSTSQARMRCEIPHDITLLNGQSHMHRLGVDYSAELVPPSASPEMLYQNDRWEDVPVKRWDSGLAISAGSKIDYHCQYDNPNPDDVFQGPRTSDEMCMFIGAYYPATQGASFCSYDQDAPIATQQIGAEWVGSGTKSCAEGLLCLQSSFGGGLKSITGCVQDVRPEDAAPFSDALGCIFANGAQEPCQAQIDTCISGGAE